MYRVTLTRAAHRALRGLPRSIAKRIDAAILALADEPRPQGSKGLQGSDYHRVRVGAYRIVYQVKDDVLEVLVIRLGHRREIYRGL